MTRPWRPSRRARGPRTTGASPDVAEADLERARLARPGTSTPTRASSRPAPERGFAMAAETALQRCAPLAAAGTRSLRRHPRTAERLWPGGRSGSRSAPWRRGGRPRRRGQRPRRAARSRRGASLAGRCAPRFPLRLHAHPGLAAIRRRGALGPRAARAAAQRPPARHRAGPTRPSTRAPRRHTRAGCATLDLAISTGYRSQVFDATELWRVSHIGLPPLVASGLEARPSHGRRRRLHRRRTTRRTPSAARPRGRRAGGRARAVARRDWEQSTTASAPAEERAVTVAALRPVLEQAHAGLLSLFLHRDLLWAVTVTPGGATLTRLPDGARVVEAAAASGRPGDSLDSPGHPGGGHRAVDARTASSGTPWRRSLRARAPGRHHPVANSLASLPWRLVPGIRGRVVTVAPSATFWARRSAPVHGAGHAEPGRLHSPVPAAPGRRARRTRSSRSGASAGAAAHDRASTGAHLRAALVRQHDRPRRRSRHPPGREPAVLVGGHGRRTGVRPRVPPHRRRRGARRPVGVRRGAVLHRAGDEPLGLHALLSLGRRASGVVAPVGPVGDEDAHAWPTTVLAGPRRRRGVEVASAGVEQRPPSARSAVLDGSDGSLTRSVASPASDEDRGLGEEGVVGVLVDPLGEADPGGDARSRPHRPAPA